MGDDEVRTIVSIEFMGYFKNRGDGGKAASDLEEIIDTAMRAAGLSSVFDVTATSRDTVRTEELDRLEKLAQ